MGDDLCSVCEEYMAEWFCRKCNRKICQECDEVIHLIEEKKKHERVPLKVGGPANGLGNAAPAPASQPVLSQRGMTYGQDYENFYPNDALANQYGQTGQGMDRASSKGSNLGAFQQQLDGTLKQQYAALQQVQAPVSQYGYGRSGQPPQGYQGGSMDVPDYYREDTRSMTDYYLSGETPIDVAAPVQTTHAPQQQRGGGGVPLQLPDIEVTEDDDPFAEENYYDEIPGWDPADDDDESEYETKPLAPPSSYHAVTDPQ
eukprot:CAMPEP_0181326236 /NCGR_PEP_ID=MMETSP1101-20121128/21377_1 /TAXON_ID=46948 /ORGANISM="Rhodomonas abbreviata, Strain Caron Lab Isolate" /LENGTH=257 /DNA_ID=CAMNT_0023434649 /DNA_START=204 /DNA_END=974 /DNA_ORIENTATION=+